MGTVTQKVFAPIANDGALVAPPLYHDEARQGSAYAEQQPIAVGLAAPNARLAYIETYGCQMNFSDTEIIAGVLKQEGYTFTREETEADLVLLNTCAIRENAEEKIWNRLKHLKGLKRKRPHLTVGLMGCMAERLKARLLEQEQLVDLVVGPDAYRDLPNLLARVDDGHRAINVLLSREETYADIAPVRLNTNGISAFISITRGCNNMCSFCVVPFTRGRERSRDWQTIVQEARDLYAQGYREVTLLGQNVDSYNHEEVGFAQLLVKVAQVAPDLRVRFTTSHPEDMTDEVLHAMAAHANICKYIHLPVQSGNSEVLERMNRGYSREWYLERIAAIRRILPGCAVSTDIITGFCGETEAEHADTLSLMREVRYDYAYMFHYSERPGTLAARRYPDDIPLEVKKARLQEVIDLQLKHNLERQQEMVGTVQTVLLEGNSKRSEAHYAGRADNNQMVVFAKGDTQYAPGAYVQVRILEATGATLIGELIGTVQTL